MIRRSALALILAITACGVASTLVFNPSVALAATAGGDGGRGGGGGGGGGGQGGEGGEGNLQAFFRQDKVAPAIFGPTNRRPRKEFASQPDGCGGDPTATSNRRRACDARQH